MFLHCQTIPVVLWLRKKDGAHCDCSGQITGSRRFRRQTLTPVDVAMCFVFTHGLLGVVYFGLVKRS